MITKLIKRVKRNLLRRQLVRSGQNPDRPLSRQEIRQLQRRLEKQARRAGL